jgi:arylsulfatase A-like enzyme
MVIGLLSAEGVQASPKNVVLILMDDVDLYDLGYNSIDGSAYNATTPTIDALASGGIKLTNFYADSPVCSPTRAALSTGMNPLQFGMDGIWPIVFDSTEQYSRALNGLPTGIARLGSEMHKLGMETLFYGKWHVGASRPEYLPGGGGWNEYQLIEPIDNHASIYTVHKESGVTSEYVEHPDTWWTDSIISDIHAKAGAGEPFFILFAPFSTHNPLVVPPGFDNSPHGFDLATTRGVYQSIMFTLDANIGRIVDALEGHGLLDDTLIVVTSDNGGQLAAINTDRTARLTGTKRWVYEGGIHVPAFMHWPAGIGAGKSNGSLMTVADLMPTLMELLGSPNLSGLNVTGTSKARAVTEDAYIVHKPVLWESAWYASRPNPPGTWQGNEMAMRKGDYKIVRLHGAEDLYLFDLVNDPLEAVDLELAEPELFAAMKDDLLQMRLDASQYKPFPRESSAQLLLDFDPRLNSHNNDLTFRFRIDVPNTIPASRNIYYHPGQLDVQLLPTGQIQVEFFSVHESTGSQVSEMLLSPPLSPGLHDVMFVIDSWREDTSAYELYVDGVSVDTQNDDVTHRTPWSSLFDPALGDAGLSLTCVGWFRLRFYPEDFTDGSVTRCDPVIDDDADAVADVIDNCSGMVNPGQADADGDGIGDLCEAVPDTDSEPDMDSEPVESPDSTQSSATAESGGGGGCSYGAGNRADPLLLLLAGLALVYTRFRRQRQA